MLMSSIAWLAAQRTSGAAEPSSSPVHVRPWRSHDCRKAGEECIRVDRKALTRFPKAVAPAPAVAVGPKALVERAWRQVLKVDHVGLDAMAPSGAFLDSFVD